MLQNKKTTEQVHALIDVINTYQSLRKKVGELQLQLSITELSVLGCIFINIDTPSKIADKLSIERATVSRSLDILELHKYISRSTSQQDRRYVLIEITSTGSRLMDKMTGRI